MSHKHTLLGLDIGSHSLKMAAVDGHARRIQRLSETPLGTLPLSDSDALSRKVHEVVVPWSNSLQNRNISVAVQGEDTWCHYMELPTMSSREMEVAVPALVRKHLPFSIESSTLSYVSVPTLHQAEKRCAIIAVAALQKGIGVLKNTLATCGLEVQRVEITPLALVREFCCNHTVDKNVFHGLLHVGSHLTQFIVVRDRFPYYVRQFKLAASDFVTAVSQESAVTRECAQQLLGGMDARDPGPVLEPILIRWLDEVKRTLHHAVSNVDPACGQEFLAQLYLSGGGCLLPGLVDRVHSHVSCPTVLDGWDRLQPSAEPESAPAAIFKAAVGLALEG